MAISIHPPLAGRDLKQQPSQSNQKNFNPPAPCGAGPPFLYHSFTKIYISIHPPLAGRDSSKDDADTVMRISIHPPLAGRDTAFLRDTLSRAISIHPPLAGRDIQFLDDFRRAKFQSTRPLRGGTLTYAPSGKRAAISIHPPLAGRDVRGLCFSAASSYFNPPAPCGAGPSGGRTARRPAHFNPPAPCGAGLRSAACSTIRCYFNPPAPCGAGPLHCCLSGPEKDFNPPAPCGAGPWDHSCLSLPQIFQSTRPLRGGTRDVPAQWRIFVISIHPPLAGRDMTGCWRCPYHGTFQSTRPLRGGTRRCSGHRSARPISIHPPLAGRDHRACLIVQEAVISIHPPLAGRDSGVPRAGADDGHFNPPAPCGAGLVDDGATISAPAFQSTRPLRGGTAILHKKTVQNIAYCTKSAFTLAVLSGFLALMRPFFLPNVHKFRCEPSEESLLAPRSHAYTIRTPSG